MNSLVKKPDLILGRYKDKALEQEYQAESFESMKQISRPIILLLSLVFIIFVIGDIISTPSTLVLILPIRLLVSLVLVYFYLRVPRINKPDHFYLFLALNELMVSGAFLYISSLYEHPNFILRILTLVLMIFAYYTLPNKFAYSTFNAIFIWFIFLLTSYTSGLLDTMKEWAVGIIFPLLYLVTAISFHLRLEIEKRQQFITNKMLIELSTKDNLTKINNRSKFESDMDSYMKSITPTDKTFTFVILDIDNFKKINDEYGHLSGDAVLIELSSLIMRTIRKQDVLARWGGEEFVIFFPDTPLKDALIIINRIKENVNENEFSNGIRITCSFGVTEFRETDSISELIGRADQLMYLAKSRGKNQIVS